MAPDPRYPDMSGAAPVGFDGVAQPAPAPAAASPPSPQLGPYPPADGKPVAAAAPMATG
jgi:hypothetical protein